MCLIIDTLPANQRASNCVPCYKWYETNWDGIHQTPYQHTTIPDSGILRVSRTSRHRLYKDRINGMAIHAMITMSRHHIGHVAKAYAFGVMAYGSTNNKDLCCSLLYIPKLDTGKNKDRIMAKIKLWMQREHGPTNAEVKKLFPQFVPPIT